MVYLFKRDPFNMTFEEIGRLTMKQAQMLLNEHQKYRKELSDAAQSRMKRFEKNAFPMIDITKDIYHG